MNYMRTVILSTLFSTAPTWGSLKLEIPSEGSNSTGISRLQALLSQQQEVIYSNSGDKFIRMPVMNCDHFLPERVRDTAIGTMQQAAQIFPEAQLACFEDALAYYQIYDQKAKESKIQTPMENYKNKALIYCEIGNRKQRLDDRIDFYKKAALNWDLYRAKTEKNQGSLSKVNLFGMMVTYFSYTQALTLQSQQNIQTGEVNKAQLQKYSLKTAECLKKLDLHNENDVTQLRTFGSIFYRAVEDCEDILSSQQKIEYLQECIFYFTKISEQEPLSLEDKKLMVDIHYRLFNLVKDKKNQLKLSDHYFKECLKETSLESFSSNSLESVSTMYGDGHIYSDSNDDQQYFARRAVELLEYVEAKEHILTPKRLLKMNTAHSNLGLRLILPQEKLASFKQSLEYWKTYFEVIPPEQIDVNNYLEIANIADHAAYYAEDFQEKKVFYLQAASLAESYLEKVDEASLSIIECVSISHFYKNAAAYIEDTHEKEMFLQKAQSYLERTPFKHVFRIGDVIFSWDGVMKTRHSLVINLPNQDSEDERVPSHAEIDTQKLSQKEQEKLTREKKRQELRELEKNARLERATNQGVQQKVFEAPLNANSLKQKEVVTVTSFIEQESVISKPTKQEKKNARLVADTFEQKPSSLPIRTKEHQIDPLTVMQIQKAYEKKMDQEKALSILNDVIEFKGLKTIKEYVAIRYLKTIQQYFSSSEEKWDGVTDVLGHTFKFHQAHGARQGDWDVGMIHRLVAFAKDVKATFEAIIEEEL